MATVLGPAEIRVKIVTEGKIPGEPPSSAAVREEETKKTERAVTTVRVASGGKEAEGGAGMSLARMAATGAAIAATVTITAETILPIVTSVLKELAPGMIADKVDKAIQNFSDQVTKVRVGITAAVPTLLTATQIFQARANLGAPAPSLDDVSRTVQTEFEINRKLDEYEANQNRDLRNDISQRLAASVRDLVKGSLGK